LKVNIKNTLIGLLVLGFFGLIYVVLSSKPEMVADSKLRVEEPPLQSPSALIQSANLDQSIEINVSEAEFDALQDEGELVATTEEALIEQVVEESVSPFADAEPVDYLKQVPLLETIVVLDGESTTQEELAENELSESISALSTTDVSVISASDEFINLNLVETKPIEMVLIEGDDLILDDVNEGLGKFESVIAEYTTKSEVSDELVQSADIDTITTVKEKPEEVFEVGSVIEVSDVDQELMMGTDKVSLEYQATMKKLLDVKRQMVAADAENARLKAKFSSVVDQNRELAILIRDIDVKIKTLTASN
jgi:hypothetical protein